ncbi:hypothetical protein [Vibrio harveyi]|uniref:hypothetical protein n=1 Tax=Vibrio harveyi TaxID=669 RepID=UPI003CF1C1A8
MELDKRYSIKPEFCGHKEKRFVVRFCGQFIDSASDIKAGNKIAQEHNESRLKTL